MLRSKDYTRLLWDCLKINQKEIASSNHLKKKNKGKSARVSLSFNICLFYPAVISAKYFSTLLLLVVHHLSQCRLIFRSRTLIGLLTVFRPISTIGILIIIRRLIVIRDQIVTRLLIVIRLLIVFRQLITIRDQISN